MVPHSSPLATRYSLLATRYSLLVLALSSVLVLAAPAGPAEAQAQGDQGLQGGWAIDDGGNAVFAHSVAVQAPLMRQAGAGWARINFRLGACYADWTSVGCNGRTALQAYDEVVGRARGQGLQILGLLSNESWPGSQAEWIANNAEVAGGNGDNAYIWAFASGAAGQVARVIRADGWLERRRVVQVGGARVSEKHANFIVNPAGAARAADIEALIAHVREAVHARMGVDLEPEVRIVGEAK